MSEAMETLEGWYALHDFRSINWDRWRSLSEDAHKEAVAQLEELLAGWAAHQEAGAGSTGTFSIIGHKADLLFLNFRPSLEELLEVEKSLDKLSSLLDRAYSYFSVVELSTYAARGDTNPETNAYLRGRLYPELPPKKNICFYPMNKRRQGADNWYMLPREERGQLMKSHGQIGGKYHERVIQIITGSQGLDDWEWGVTLFADDPLQFKKLIYEMRFDETSARYADFGPFFVGSRMEPRDLATFLTR